MTTSGALLERGAEHDAVEAAVTQARAGAGRLVIVEGAAGIGKTALLADAARMAEAAGVRVLWGTGRAQEADYGFGVALQLFEPIAASPADDLPALLTGAASLAGPLLHPDPSLRWPAWEDHSFALIHGLHWLTINLAERAPVLVVIDDAHWADRGSLRYLLYLAERIGDVPVSLVVALRPHAAGHSRDLVAQLRAKRDGRLLALEALSRRGIAELTRTRFFAEADDDFCDAIHDVSAGNPFLAVEYLTTLDLEGTRPSADAIARVRSATPPRAIRATLARLSALTPEARGAAAALAIVGDKSEPDLIAELADLPAAVTASAIDELRGAELVGPGEPVHFVHPLIDQAVAEELTHAERQQLHALAAPALARRGAPVERVAAHLLRSPPANREWAVAALWAAAARAMAAGQPESARELLARALAEPPIVDVEPELTIDLGLAELACGEAGGLDRLWATVGALRSRVRRAEVLTDVGEALRQYARHAEAAQAFEHGLGLIREEKGELHLRLRLRLEAGYLSTVRLDQSVHQTPGPHLHRLLEDATADHSPEAGAVMAELAYRAVAAGSSREEVSRLTQATVEDPADRSSHLPAVAALAWIEEFDAADALAGRILRAAQSEGRILAVATASFRRSHLRWLRGELVGALADAEQALDAAPYGWRVYLPAAIAVAALCLTERAELHGAAAKLERLPAYAGSDGAPHALYLFARGRLRLVLDDPAGATDDFLAAGEALAATGGTNPALLPWRTEAAMAMLASGDDGAARRLAQEALRHARQFGVPGPVATALRPHLLLADRDRLVDVAEEAVAAASQSAALLTRARVFVEAGAALRRAGWKARARQLLADGAELASRCGATALAVRAEEEGVAAGARPRHRSDGRPGELTPGEHRVVMLAAEGLTNREIAQRLFITVKAVEWHLNHAYGKLGIRSRTELQAALAAAAS